MGNEFTNCPVIPFRGQHFAAPISSANGFCTVADLLREVADWMEANRVEDPEFEGLRLGLTFTNGTADEFYHHATLHYRLEGDKMR